MSDVLVKGMKMPKNCGCCDMCVLSNDKQTFFCTRQLGKRFRWSLVEKRQEGCPLVEVREAEVGDLNRVKSAYVTGKKIWMEANI